MMPPELLIAGVSLTVIVPALVEGAKGLGLPTKYAGLASILACAIVLGLVELREDPSYGAIAAWLLLSIVYGLAAAGLYSQVRLSAIGYRLSADGRGLGESDDSMGTPSRKS
jgi:hypothetical protein